MQTACIEFARNVCELKDADSTEFDVDTPHPIIFKLRDLVGVEELGGTMRLGAWPAAWRPIHSCATFTAARKRSANAIGIVTNSTPSFGSVSNAKDLSSVVFRRMASLSK